MTSYTWTLKPYHPRSYILARYTYFLSWTGFKTGEQYLYHIHDGSDSVNDTLMTQATDGYWKLHLPAAIAVFLSTEPSDSDLPHNHH